MEMKNHPMIVKESFHKQCLRLKSSFFKKSSMSEKDEINFSGFKWLGLSGLTIFVGYVLMSPDEPRREFTQKMQEQTSSQENDRSEGQTSSEHKSVGNAQGLWSSAGARPRGNPGGGSQVNYNTPMLISSKFGNAKTQFRAGLRIPVRIVDKFVVSDTAVPILAESILDSTTDSGIKIPAGSKFYGEATFARGSERCQINFKQISLPSGEIKPISALGIGKNGQSGIEGNVFSDGAKNTAGKIITSFVGGLAAGSVQTDPFGHSRGGIENGLLAAVAEAAKTRAQDYGEKLKAQREWIEVNQGVELNALLKETVNFNEGGNP